MKRKREAGAGRKPKGEFRGKSAWMSTRITQDLRDKLEEAVKAKPNRSLSQEIEARLMGSFAFEQNRDPFLRALFFLFTEAASRTPATGHELKTDAWKFLAFRSAIVFLLDRLIIEGEATMPQSLQGRLSEIVKSPEMWGEIIATGICAQLNTVLDLKAYRELGFGDPVAELGQPADGSLIYTFPSAREALGIELDEKRAVEAVFMPPGSSPEVPYRIIKERKEKDKS